MTQRNMTDIVVYIGKKIVIFRVKLYLKLLLLVYEKSEERSRSSRKQVFSGDIIIVFGSMVLLV